MRSRTRLVLPLVLVAAVVGVPSAATGSPRVGSSFFLVQPDPRLCPSPLCGGYWVSLANHARTRCSDGVLRSRCYVANATDEKRNPLRAPITGGALARAEVEPWRYESFGELGVLVVARVFAPMGQASPSGRFYRLVDVGIRCVRAPCFSIRGSLLNRTARATVSGVDLGAVPVDERGRIEAALGSTTGALAQGRIVPTSEGGRVFRATRFFLASER